MNVENREKHSNLHLVNGALQLRKSTSNDHDMSAFAGKLKSGSPAHAIRATSDKDGLGE